MAVSSSTAIFLLSLLGVPISWIVNTASTLHGEIGLLVSGTVSLIVLAYLTHLCVKRPEQQTDYLFYVFILGTFASVVDLIIALENDGIIYGFMTQYLKNGEPYLKSAYGTMICYWDGIAHYAMYLMMLAARAWNQTFYEVGLYWVGSIMNSMIVLLYGAVIGKHGVRWSTLLNVPYGFIPLYGGAKFLRERPKQLITSEQASQEHTSIWKRPVDVLFILYLLLAMVTTFLRGLAVLGSQITLFQSYVSTFEPYLEDSTSFPKMQMLVYLFYFVPYYGMAMYGLLFPSQHWMLDWSLIHAGAAAQAQFSHIGSSLHHRTPYILRVPRVSSVRTVFWLVNTTLFIVPQLLAYRCSRNPVYFLPVRPDRRKSSVHIPDISAYSHQTKLD